jgi:phosphosulfolactate synthase
MTDRGLSCRQSEDLMEVAGEIVDRVKLNDHCGVLSRYSEQWFARKFQIYRQHGIRCMPGGIPFELAALQGKTEYLFTRLREVGFDTVEISEDVIPAIPRDDRNLMIRQAISAGLEVITELGRKVPDSPIDVDLAVEMATNDLELGVRKVTLEHSELRLFHEGDSEPLRRLVDRIGLEHLIFEPNPGGWPWLHVWLIENLGPHVNMGNIYPEELVVLDAMRRGMTRAVGYPFLTKSQGRLDS